MARRSGHAGKVDANHSEIVATFEAMGVVVRSLASVGDGMNDLLCVMPEATFLVEIKMPGEKLTPAQNIWHSRAPWRNHVAYSITDAIELVGHYRRPNRWRKRA